MCQLIEEVLTAAMQANVTPARIRLGRRQMQQFREWAVRFVSRGAPTPGPSEEYAGIPLDEVNEETHRSVIDADGQELILD